MKLNNVTIAGKNFTATVSEVITPRGTNEKLRGTGFTTKGAVLLAKVTEGNIYTGMLITVFLDYKELHDVAVRIEENHKRVNAATVGMEVGICLQENSLGPFQRAMKKEMPAT